MTEEKTEQESDWAWRRRIRSNTHTHRIYRWVVGIIGVAVTIGGLILVPAPGPGWVIVFVGVAILASEFVWAQVLLAWGKARLGDWNDWLAPKALWFKGLVGLATLAVVLAVFYGTFLVSGVPGFIPDVAENRIRDLPGL
ncbi:uncharacterized protein (TIGR02611 family) [Phycicoccus badiiscoriae]|uniref:Uncharacterized protein (TIGR02611 family) n=1 Tax=Pedococcus badiiscoriae TaxID=642776 RepID=A0A852WLZ1_9MICO|nr:uncharacterized protein (TIGR02611 family) [Pedococcus badiiscoriae]